MYSCSPSLVDHTSMRHSVECPSYIDSNYLGIAMINYIEPSVKAWHTCNIFFFKFEIFAQIILSWSMNFHHKTYEHHTMTVTCSSPCFCRHTWAWFSAKIWNHFPNIYTHHYWSFSGSHGRDTALIKHCATSLAKYLVLWSEIRAAGGSPLSLHCTSHQGRHPHIIWLTSLHFSWWEENKWTGSTCSSTWSCLYKF